jgi:hypothetical protein
MHLIYFLFSAICFIAAVFAPVNATGALILILASLGFLFYGIWRLLKLRMGGRSTPVIAPLSPDELRVLREKSEQNRTGSTPRSPDA